MSAIRYNAPGLSATDVPITQQTLHHIQTQVQLTGPQMQARKQARRLYVGNLPAGSPNLDTNLSDFFNTAMTAAGLTTAAGNSVMSVWLSPDQKYGFVEFRSTEETSNGMSLDQIEFQGRQIKVSRPNDYVQAGGEAALGGGNPAGALGNLTNPLALQAAAAAAAAAANAGLAPKVDTSVGQFGSISRVVCFSNMFIPDTMNNETEHKEVVEDTFEESSKYGNVRTVIIPLSTDPKPKCDYYDKCFVAFYKSDDAIRAQLSLNGRRFDANPVLAQFFNEQLFDQLFELDPLPPEILGKAALAALPSGAGLD